MTKEKEKIGIARPEGPPLRGFRGLGFYTGLTDVEENVYAGVIVQKLETEDTLTGLTDVEENAYVGALPNEDR